MLSVGKELKQKKHKMEKAIQKTVVSIPEKLRRAVCLGRESKKVYNKI